MPLIESSKIDRLNLEAALRDFETANARVVDLTSRLTLLNESLQQTRHELNLTRIKVVDIEAVRVTARSEIVQVRSEASTEVERLKELVRRITADRDAARAETAVYKNSRSYRIGYKLTRIGRKFIP
jgi:hypothetical protein